MELARLKEPFAPDHIEWRLQQAGKKSDGTIWAKALAYVTARAIMDRLDEVCGPENWRDEYKPGPTGDGLMCGIGILIGEEWVTKWDGAGNTEVEAVKGGFSGAFKRAAVKWGIGRYLYDLSEGWAKVHDKGAFRGKTKEGAYFHWDAPDLPSWALPSGNGKPHAAAPRQAPPPQSAPVASRQAEKPGQVEVETPDDSDPPCPKCSGKMWDNREGKRNPKAPDFKCRDKACDGVIWPPKGAAKKAPATVPPQVDEEVWEQVGDDGLPF